MIRTYYFENVWKDDELFYKRKYLGEDWYFTGNLKYIKRDACLPTELLLEIAIYKTCWFDKLLMFFGASAVRTQWVHEEYFYEDKDEDISDGQLGVLEWRCEQ